MWGRGKTEVRDMVHHGVCEPLMGRNLLLKRSWEGALENQGKKTTGSKMKDICLQNTIIGIFKLLNPEVS